MPESTNNPTLDLSQKSARVELHAARLLGHQQAA